MLNINKMEKKEILEVQVLTEEQINALPIKIHGEVIFLTDNLAPSELAKLNPILVNLGELKEEVSKLSFKPADEEGNFDKKNIQTYVDAKKNIRSFNSKLKASAKEMKAPYQRINKGLIAIEKEFLAEGKALMEKAQESFKDYDAEMERIKAEKQAKKDAELLAKVAEAEEASKALQEKSSKAETYNRIKYEKISAMITEQSTIAVNSSNENALLELLDVISDYNFGSMLIGSDIDVLDDSVVEELQGYFETSKQNAIGVINNRLAQYKTERDNLVLETENKAIQSIEVKSESVSSVPPPPPIGAPKGELSLSFSQELVKKIELFGYRNAGGILLNDSAEWKTLKKLLN